MSQLGLFGFGILVWSQVAVSQVLFEGYYKIQSQSEHIGYSIQRYESLDNGKIFKATVFVKTNALGGNLTESIVTESGPGMAPIKMSYTGIVGKQTKTIDARIQEGSLIAEVREGGKVQSSKLTLDPGIFFSGILIYSILKSPQGLVPETQYNYSAIAEESLELIKGKAIVQTYGEFRSKIRSLKVLNEFRDTKFISWVTEKGEILETTAPVQGLTTELVPNAEMAQKGQVVPEKILKTLFGSLPKGQENIAYRAHQKGEWPISKSVEPVPGHKTQPVPPGKGIHTK